jgi:hypothetical protein
MNRLELLRSPDYWLSGAALDLYRVATEYLDENHLKWSDLENLGIPKRVIKNLKDGDLLPGPEYYDVACRLGYQPILKLNKNKEAPKVPLYFFFFFSPGFKGGGTPGTFSRDTILPRFKS